MATAATCTLLQTPKTVSLCQQRHLHSHSASASLPCLTLRPNRSQQQSHRPRPLRIVAQSADVESPSTAPPSSSTSSSGKLRREDLPEQYAVVDSGKWECNSCGYVFDQAKGDPSYPIASGLDFSQVPEDWQCPTCGAAKQTFRSKSRELAGFVQNQGYGLGTNTMTSDQKGLLIWGTLGFFFFLFLGGYFLE